MNIRLISELVNNSYVYYHQLSIKNQITFIISNLEKLKCKDNKYYCNLLSNLKNIKFYNEYNYNENYDDSPNIDFNNALSYLTNRNVFYFLGGGVLYSWIRLKECNII